VIPQWIKSRHSNYQGNCVEIATIGTECGVRDSRCPSMVLVLPCSAVSTLIAGIRAGDFTTQLTSQR
jgi:hypothetical protein